MEEEKKARGVLKDSEMVQKKRAKIKKHKRREGQRDRQGEQ